MKLYWSQAHKDRGLSGWQPVPDLPRSPRVYIHGDTIEPMRSMANGRHYTSKSRYFADAKALGYECVGNEFKYMTTIERPEPPDAEGDLRKTASELGMVL